MELELFINSTFEILKAVPTTLSLVTLSLSIGFIMAIFLVAMSLSKLMLVRFFANSYIYYFRGTPLLIQIYLMYFGFGYWLSMHENVKQSIFLCMQKVLVHAKECCACTRVLCRQTSAF